MLLVLDRFPHWFFCLSLLLLFLDVFADLVVALVWILRFILRLNPSCWFAFGCFRGLAKWDIVLSLVETHTIRQIRLPLIKFILCWHAERGSRRRHSSQFFNFPLTSYFLVHCVSKVVQFDNITLVSRSDGPFVDETFCIQKVDFLQLIQLVTSAENSISQFALARLRPLLFECLAFVEFSIVFTRFLCIFDEPSQHFLCRLLLLSIFIDRVMARPFLEHLLWCQVAKRCWLHRCLSWRWAVVAFIPFLFVLSNLSPLRRKQHHNLFSIFEVVFADSFWKRSWVFSFSLRWQTW